MFRELKFNQSPFRRGAETKSPRRLLPEPRGYFAAEEATNFWKRGSLPATAGKLRLRLGTSINSRLRVCQFLETRIFAQPLKHWIQPEQRRSERRVCG